MFRKNKPPQKPYKFMKEDDFESSLTINFPLSIVSKTKEKKMLPYYDREEHISTMMEHNYEVWILQSPVGQICMNVGIWNWVEIEPADQKEIDSLILQIWQFFYRAHLQFKIELPKNCDVLPLLIIIKNDERLQNFTWSTLDDRGTVFFYNAKDAHTEISLIGSQTKDLGNWLTAAVKVRLNLFPEIKCESDYFENKLSEDLILQRSRTDALREMFLKHGIGQLTYN